MNLVPSRHLISRRAPTIKNSNLGLFRIVRRDRDHTTNAPWVTGWMLLSLDNKHIPFRNPAPLHHLIAVIQMRRMFVTRIRPEAEFQAGPFSSPDEILVGNMCHLVDLDGNLAGARQLDDAVDALRRPELRVLPRDGQGQERGPGEDVDRLGG